MNETIFTISEATRCVASGVTSTDYHWILIMLMLFGFMYVLHLIPKMINLTLFSVVYIYAFFKWCFDYIRGKK